MHPLVTAVAEYLIYVLGVAAVVVWFTLAPSDRWKALLQAIIAAAFSLALAKVAGQLYYDPRPFVSGHVHPYFTHAADNGFPSDHTTAASVAGYVLWSYRRRIAVVLLIGAALVGISRVIAHVHSPVDIIGALIISGIGSLIGVYVGAQLWNRWQARTVRA